MRSARSLLGRLSLISGLSSLKARSLGYAARVAGIGALSALTLTALPADASVSIAVPFDALVQDADAVALAIPVESKSVWEGGRIYTYTRLKVEEGVAGSVAGDVWVRTMGGVVGSIGQLVDGEATFAPGKTSMLFLRKFKADGTWEVSARAQGQFPVLVDEVRASKGDLKARKVVRGSNVGTILPPKPGAVVPPRLPTTVKLAADVLHERPLDEAVRDVADAWKRLHPHVPTK